MMLFHADESVTPESPGVFTLAGFLAAPTAWNIIERAWRPMLCGTGPFPVSAIHAKPLERRDKPFDAWSDAECEALVDVATGVIVGDGKSNIYMVGCSIVTSDLERIPGFPTGEIDRYLLCYETVLNAILGAPIAMNGIELVFDERRAAQTCVREHFNAYRERHGLQERLSDVRFVDDRKCMPVQAADLLSYHLRRKIRDRKQGESPIRKTYELLKESFPRELHKGNGYRGRFLRCYDNHFVDDALKFCDSWDKIQQLWHVLPVRED
jgi:hypothetical protein